MNNNSSSTRLPIPQYVMTLAHAAALRSEDPYRKVGAAALDADNRVIGTAYNGLYPGFKAQDTFWASREERQKYMLHAEINLCSLFRRGEAKVVACTTMPCTSCMQALCAHGVKTIYYCEPYDKSEAPAIASLYGGKGTRMPAKEVMDGLDVIVVDIQDVGLRYYTYYCTMIDLMNAAKAYGKQVVVLDRPNPNGM
ncbi:exo-beta-N-acetylmuramidase NamZ domain-containing protein, partial [uncultured Akkermansia sp.]|uniref:exo-beta-N-acetylmuramidase NamZ domain-containing protein n=1 Tax=uncultured Akkermansia sp. TaxID=512294 RepID=UPI00261999CB